MDNYEDNKAMITEALAYIPADDYDTYRDVVAALKHEALTGKLSEADAKDLAQTWAQTSTKYDAKEFADKWKSFKDAYGGDLIGAGSIIKMAKDYGYKPTGPQAVAFDIGSTIDLSGLSTANMGHSMNALPDNPLPPAEQEKQIMQFLDLFGDDERVNIVVQASQKDGKWIPEGKGTTRTAKEWKQSIHASFSAGKGPFSDFYGALDDNGNYQSYNPEAGVWVRINPTDGHGVADSNITSFRHALIESDNLDKARQLQLVKKIGATLLAVDSGKKSIHAVVNLNAYSLRDYRIKVQQLHAICAQMGLAADPNTKNPSRLMRLPGIQRGGHWQRTVYSPKTDDVLDFSAWKAYLTMGLPEDISSDWQTFDPATELAPQLIQGVLRCGHKMLIAGPSKAGKSFALLELAAAIVTGGKWLGRQCRKGKILYVNFEIDPASSKNRIHKVFAAIGHPEGPPVGAFSVWNLRGKPIEPDAFIANVIRFSRGKNYSAIIIDPVYKLMTGTDENSAGDIGSLVVKFDRICAETGAAVIIAHHFSKGSAYGKSFQNVADRASGSGVFGRDPDAIATMMQLVWDPATFGRPENETAWRVSFSLREFPPPQDLNCFFNYPVHLMDTDGLLKDRPFVGNPGVNGGKASGASRAEQTKDLKADVLTTLNLQMVDNDLNPCVKPRKFYNIDDSGKRTGGFTIYYSISTEELADIMKTDELSRNTLNKYLAGTAYECRKINGKTYILKKTQPVSQ